MSRDKVFRVGMLESEHEGGCPWGLIIKACVLSNLHGISLKVHSGGREIFKSDAKSVLMLSIPQKQKTLKGASKVLVKNDIHHDHYATTLETNKIARRNATSIRSFNHQIYTHLQEKIALTNFYERLI